MNEKQITDLARPLVRILEEFYKDARNQEAFREWLEVQNAQSNRNP